MKSIAQEVRLYNKNADDFQRVRISFCFFLFVEIESNVFLLLLLRKTMQNLSVDQIEQRLALLDEIMEIELKEVQNRFHSKRKPILEAIKLKKQNQNQH